MKAFPRRAAALALCLLLAAAGCDSLENFCNPLSQTSATVVMQGAAEISPPVPVTLNGVAIGEVRGKSLDEAGKATLQLCLDHGQAEKLSRLTVFYVDRLESGKGDRLVCQTFPDQDAPASEQMRFLGFASYEDFLAWRAKGIMKKGLDSFLKALDDALGQAR